MGTFTTQAVKSERSQMELNFPIHILKIEILFSYNMAINFSSHKDAETWYLSNFYGENLKLQMPFGEKHQQIVNWMTSEAYFQAQKFLIGINDRPVATRSYHIDYALIILVNKSAFLSATLGRQKSHRFNHKIRIPVGLRRQVSLALSIDFKDIDWDNLKVNQIISAYIAKGVKMYPQWNDIRDSIMRKVIKAKFDQNPELKLRLLATDGPIVEHTKRDSYWGDGGGNGVNRLGQILEEYRNDN